MYLHRDSLFCRQEIQSTTLEKEKTIKLTSIINKVGLMKLFLKVSNLKFRFISYFLILRLSKLNLRDFFH